MRQALLYHVDGRIDDITPELGKKMSLERLQLLCGGDIQTITFPDGRVLACNEVGIYEGLPANANATMEWRKAFPIEKYPINNAPVILGNVVIASRSLL